MEEDRKFFMCLNDATSSTMDTVDTTDPKDTIGI